jgi:hypothetical protein
MFATQNTKIFTRKWKLILKFFAHIHCVNEIFWQPSRQLELANFKINAPYWTKSQIRDMDVGDA